jgi:glucokinase
MIIGLNLHDHVPQPSEKFPQPGSLESLAAGTELDRLARRYAEAYPESELARRLVERGAVTGRDAVDAARQGDDAGLRALRLLGERLGVGIANAINIFDPAEVVIGGGVSAAGELLLGPAREAASRFVLPGVGTQTKIRLARQGTGAGVLGAALNAMHEYQEQQ